MTDDMQRAREKFEAWLSPYWSRGGDIDEDGDFVYREEWVQGAWVGYRAALRTAPEWQPIETAPEGRLVVVGWLDTEDSHYPENYEFDYLEDGIWAKHEDCVEHAFAVAPPGSKMPKEQPPYQWWMDLPAFPAARPQEAIDATK